MTNAEHLHELLTYTEEVLLDAHVIACSKATKKDVTDAMARLWANHDGIAALCGEYHNMIERSNEQRKVRNNGQAVNRHTP